MWPGPETINPIIIPRPWLLVQGWAGPMTFNDIFVGAAGFKVEVFPIRFVLRAWKAGILAVTLELTRNPRLKPIQMQTE